MRATIHTHEAQTKISQENLLSTTSNEHQRIRKQKTIQMFVGEFIVDQFDQEFGVDCQLTDSILCRSCLRI